MLDDTNFHKMEQPCLAKKGKENSHDFNVGSRMVWKVSVYLAPLQQTPEQQRPQVL